MPHLSPPTLTTAEPAAILAATAGHPRDHVIYSLALGTGLRLAEVVGLNVGDIYAPDGRPRSRVRTRTEVAKGGRAGDVFLPDALLPKLRRFWAYKRARGEGTGAPQQPGRVCAVSCDTGGVAARSGGKLGLIVRCRPVTARPGDRYTPY